MPRGFSTMSLLNLFQKLHVFTTQVKTNNVPVLSYSTSTLLIVIISLRYNIIPFHHLLLFFLFLLYQNSNFLLQEIDEKSDQKNQYFEKFLACKNGSGEHEELANDAYHKIKGVNFASNNAQLIYTSLWKVLKCPASSLFNSTLFNFYAWTRFWVVYWGSNPKMEWSQGDKITISRNILAVKNDFLIIKGIPCMPKIATLVCNYNFEVVLINIKVKTCHMMLQNYNITCHLQEAGVILHIYTNISEYVTTQTWKQSRSWKNQKILQNEKYLTIAYGESEHWSHFVGTNFNNLVLLIKKQHTYGLKICFWCWFTYFWDKRYF